MTTRPFYLRPKNRTGLAAGLWLLVSTTAFSVESLHGPELGEALWMTTSKQTPSDTAVHKERFANIDIPVPLALPLGMPFATIQYRDTTGSPTRRFAADQRVGLGFLHHPGEGDPAWRVDVSRSGLWSVQGALWARLIVNLLKPYPWLKLRPSDTVNSWIGVHGIDTGHKKIRLIPEFAWISQDNRGLTIDLLAPQHLFLGYQGPIFGLVLGPEQSLRHWTTHRSDGNDDFWIVQQQLRAKASLALSPSFIFCISGLRAISQAVTKPAVGAELSMRWIPNP